MPSANRRHLINVSNKRSGPSMIAKTRKFSHVNTLPASKMQTGEGFYDIVRSVYKKGKDLAGKASDLYSSDIGTALKNLVPASDETARPSYRGEKHAILDLGDGKNGIANYMGPGTNVIERVKRGDPGRTFADTVAKRHDIDYVMAAGLPTKAKQLAAVRAADDRMINSLSKNKDKDSSRNINMGLQLIKAKKLGEDFGLLSKEKFAGDLSKIPDSERILLMNTRRDLTQQGFGINPVGGAMLSSTKPLLPGERLKRELLKKSLKSAKKSQSLLGSQAGLGVVAMPTNLSGDKDLAEGYVLQSNPIGEGLNLPGKGFNLPGSGLKISGSGKGRGKQMTDLLAANSHLAVVKLPKILMKLGIKIPVNTLSDVISSAMTQPGPLPAKLKILTNSLLPLMGASKYSKMSGRGLKLAGQGLSDVAAVMPKQLTTKLHKALREYYKRRLGKSKKQKGSGETFWEGFARGFLSVFRPGAKLIGAIATSLGVPEIGVPLSAIGNAI